MLSSKNWSKQDKLVIAPNLKSVLVLDKVAKAAVSILRTAGFEVTEADGGLTTEGLVALVEQVNADAIILRSGTKITAEFFKQCQRIVVIARAGVGVDNIDVAAAKKHGVLVINSPDGNTLSAVEHTCSLMMSLARQLDKVMLNRWDQWKEAKKSVSAHHKICELNGKCLGVLGLGRVGSRVGERMHSFGMSVIGYDPLWPRDSDNIPKWLSGLVSIDELCKQADYITLHMPLIKETQDLINTEFLKKCKPGMKIINCARGGIVKEADLLQALDNGLCSGAALDVLVEEPPTENSTSAELVQHPRVIVTPHLGAGSVEAQDRVALDVANAICVLGGKNDVNDQSSLSTTAINAIQGYVITGLEGGVNLNPTAKDYLKMLHKNRSYVSMMTVYLPSFTWRLASILAEKATVSNTCNLLITKGKNFDVSSISRLTMVRLEKAVKNGLANLEAIDWGNMCSHFVCDCAVGACESPFSVNIKFNEDPLESEEGDFIQVSLTLLTDGPEQSIEGKIGYNLQSYITARDGSKLDEVVDL